MLKEHLVRLVVNERIISSVYDRYSST